MKFRLAHISLAALAGILLFRFDLLAADHAEKAHTIIGMGVTDSKNQKVGKVAELAIDLQAGRVAEVLIDTGGYLTTKGRLIAVPPQTLTFTEEAKDLKLNTDLDAFDGAPAFNASTWKRSTDVGSVVDVYKRFHVEAFKGIGFLQPATKLAGLAAKNQQNEKVGKIEALVVELPRGRVPDVILSTSEVAQGGLTAFPPQSFLYVTEYNALLLDISKSALRQVPHFTEANWRIGIASPAVPTVNKAPNTNATDTPEARNDQLITTEIQRRILMAQDLSVAAHHVVVETEKGEVTLKGVVETEAEKKGVEDIAATVVQANHVHNDVQVRTFASLHP